MHAPPDRHALCYELLVVETAADDDENADDATRRKGIAFVAFGASNGGTSMPWLPLRSQGSSSQPGFGHHRFDAASVDRLVVLPAFRGRGAKEILLRLGGDAFHSLGLPLRVKTASPNAHASFSRCPLLVFQGHRHRGRCGTGRGSKEGFVHWFVGSPVIHADSMQEWKFVFATDD